MGDERDAASQTGGRPWPFGDVQLGPVLAPRVGDRQDREQCEHGALREAQDRGTESTSSPSKKRNVRHQCAHGAVCKLGSSMYSWPPLLSRAGLADGLYRFGPSSAGDKPLNQSVYWCPPGLLRCVEQKEGERVCRRC